MGGVDLIVRGGRVVCDTGEMEADLYVAGGRIVAVGQLDVPAREVVDAGGLLVFPGFVDAHVHFMDPGDPSREDFPTGSSAAAVAGVTTVIEHTHASPVHTGSQLQEKARYLRGRSVIDFACAAHFSPGGPDDVADVWRAGAAFIKVFTCTTHGIRAVEPGPLLEAMRRLQPRGATFLVHAEDEAITRWAEQALRAARRDDGGVIPEWRHPVAERVAVSAVGWLAEVSGARVVVAHCSHPEVVDTVAAFRARGARMWAETCPQYLLLREDEAVQLGAFRKFTPPARARSDADLERMWQLVRDGQIAYVASDHAPATRAQKREGSIWDVHFGLPGIDTTSALLIDAALEGRISPTRLAELYAAAPARLYGLYPRKGTLRPGSDADLVLVDPSARRVLRDEDVLSRAGWTPYHGRLVKGAVVATYLRGRKVAEGGRPNAPPGTGEWIPGPGARGRGETDDHRGRPR